MRMLLLAFAVAVSGWLTPILGNPPPENTETTLQLTVKTVPNVLVSLGIDWGGIIVRGWDRSEVRARSTDGRQIEMRRNSLGGDFGPATSVKVVPARSSSISGQPGTTPGCPDIELDVPRGAILRLRTRSGEVIVKGVAEVDVVTLSGDVDLSSASKAIGVSSISGDVSVVSSTGRIRLQTVSGTIDVSNLSTTSTTDYLKLGSVSGDIELYTVNYPTIEITSTSGNVSMRGSLVRGGRYSFNTSSGDVDIAVLDNPSFQLHAKALRGGVIRTDFPLRPIADASHTKQKSPDQHLNGIYGDGATVLDISSFNGDIRLYRIRK